MPNSYKYAIQSDQARIDGLKEVRKKIKSYEKWKKQGYIEVGIDQSIKLLKDVENSLRVDEQKPVGLSLDDEIKYRACLHAVNEMILKNSTGCQVTINNKPHSIEWKDLQLWLVEKIGVVE